MKSRGRMVVVCAAAAVLLVSAAAVDPLQGYLCERYWAERLRTTTGEEQEEAAKKLAELKPVRTARALIADIRSNETEKFTQNQWSVRHATPSVYALWLLKILAAPAVDDAIAAEQAASASDARLLGVIAGILDTEGPPVLPLSPAQPSADALMRSRFRMPRLLSR